MVVPRRLLALSWALHSAVDRLTGGRVGTYRPGRRPGALFLETTGRRTGRRRRTGLMYIEDRGACVVLASNGGAPNDPAWWLNLRADPDAVIEVRGARTRVRARQADAAEAERLYDRFVEMSTQYATYRDRVGRPIPVVILEPLESEATGSGGHGAAR